MSLTDGTSTIMPVVPSGMGFGNGNGMCNGFGGDGWWVLLFLLALGNGGWGNGWGAGGGNGAMFNDVNRNFDNLGLSNQIQSVQNSVDNIGTKNQLSDIQSALTSGFASAELAACGRAADAMQTAYNNQIAALGQFNAMNSAFQNCCCENRLAVANQNALIQQTARDIMTNATGNTQAIMDKLCQLELDNAKSQLDAERRENLSLQNQLNMATLRESQASQTAQLMQDNNAQTMALIQRIAPYPSPAYVVGNPYQSVNPCGCGCAQ